jgi:hypothetical protein
MQFDVNIRLYEYRHEQVKIRKKRWNNKEIKKFSEICDFIQIGDNVEIKDENKI